MPEFEKLEGPSALQPTTEITDRLNEGYITDRVYSGEGETIEKEEVISKIKIPENVSIYTDLGPNGLEIT